jgi:hypothetical protein
MINNFALAFVLGFHEYRVVLLLNALLVLKFLFASAISMIGALSPYFRSDRQPKILSIMSISLISMSDSLRFEIIAVFLAPNLALESCL